MIQIICYLSIDVEWFSLDCRKSLFSFALGSHHFVVQCVVKLAFRSHAFSRLWRELHAIASSFDWFIAGLSVSIVSFVIGWCNYFGLSFLREIRLVMKPENFLFFSS